MQYCWWHPFLPLEEPADQMLMSPPSESPHYSHKGNSFMFRCMSWVDKVCHHHPGGIYPESKWEWGSATKCKMSAPAQHETGETPLGWVNREFCVFLLTFPRAALLDQGWKVWCRGKGICTHQHWHFGYGGTDHTNEVRKIWPITISSIPPLFILETASLKLRGMKWTC